ncbi:MAG: winged helix-turn-helix domain-containing protein [Novosphingobium sp.]|nr:winged helix-turn-helix domain-containing protein [Novosphingobium sp.]
MRVFRWLNENELPPALDLRDCGWHLLSPRKQRSECVALADAAAMDPASWQRFLTRFGHADRRLIMLLGIAEPGDRARLLRFGFGEVLGTQHELKELEARALRLTELENMLPRFRQIGPLRLDLLARDAFVEGDPLGLHPREFGLLWRLSDKPGKPLSKRRLIEDVWHLRFVPETNSLAVHVSRLRAKLRIFEIADLLRTTRNGDYVLIESKAESDSDPPEVMVKVG